MVTSFSACAKSASQIDNSSYITKGTFFEMFIGEMGLYPISCTEEELEEDKEYKFAAQTISDWKLMKAEKAKEGLNSKVTREIVATVCINNMYFKETGNPDDIKDIEKVDDKQAIADSVATGLFQLESGYFMAERKMTYDECMAVIEKSANINADGHFSENEGTFDFDTTGMVEIDNDVMPEEDIKLVNSSSVVQVEDNDQAINIINLSNTDNGTKITECSRIPTNTYKISASAWKDINKKKKLETGDVIFYRSHPNNMSQRDLLNRKGQISRLEPPLAIVGKLKTVKDMGNNGVLITVEPLSTEQINDKITVEKTGKHISLDSNFFKNIINENAGSIKEATGCDINVESAPNDGVQISASKEITFSNNKYSNVKSKWRNSKITPKFETSLTISNCYVDINNWKDFIKNKNHNAIYKLSFDSSAEFSVDTGGLRFTPDTNGNSGWKNAISRSRFTDDDAAGAKRIKLTKSPIVLATLYGVLSICVNIYLEVHVDGTISIALVQENAIGIDNQSGHIRPIKKKAVRSVDTNVKVNIQAFVDIEPNVSIFGSNWLDMSIDPGIQVSATANIFKENKEDNSVHYECLENGVYAGEKELKQEIKEDNTLHYCFDVNLTWKIKLQFITSNCEIGKILRKINVLEQDSLVIDSGWQNFPKKIGIHIDDGNLVDKCTFNDEEKSENDTNTISLEKYDIDINEGTCSTIKITKLPLSKKKLNKEYKGVKVKTDDKKVATVSISDDYSVIYVDAVGPGVTTGTVYVKKFFLGPKQFAHKFTIIVSDKDTVYIKFDTNENMYSLNNSVLNLESVKQC